MPFPKIAVFKKVILKDGKHFRYYRVFRDLFTLDPDDETGKYVYLNVCTEKQFVRFLFENYGAGDYMCSAFVKGRRGLWTFWKGTIQEDGWIFHVKDRRNEELIQIDKEMAKAESEEERNMLLDDYNFFKNIALEENKGKKYGFSPYLRTSGRRGQFIMWDEPDKAFDETFSSIRNNKRNVDPSMMTIDEINSFD